MKLPRLLGHGLLIAVFVALFFVYDQRAAFFPEWFAPPRATLNAVAPGPTSATGRTVERPRPEVVLEKRPSGSREPAPAVTPQPTLEAQLERARALYWHEDMRGAAAIYQALTEAYPDNPDVWGEAGNFYFSQQQRDLAAEAYYHAIDLLIQQGRLPQARQLLDVMHQLDAAAARKLERRLAAAGG